MKSFYMKADWDNQSVLGLRNYIIVLHFLSRWPLSVVKNIPFADSFPDKHTNMLKTPARLVNAILDSH